MVHRNALTLKKTHELLQLDQLVLVNWSEGSQYTYVDVVWS